MGTLLSISIIIFSLLHLIIPSLSLHTIHHQGNETDQHALLDIKSKITQDPSQLLTSWNESIPLCEWWGITCGHRHKQVVRLDLSSSNLVGTLSPSVGNLSFLRELILYNNTFKGVIPPQVGRLSKLRLMALKNNSFTGEIPSNLSRCMSLTKLFLSFNNLMGRIPIELSSLQNLKLLSLAVNNLSGRLNETLITNMTSLEKLSLDTNQLEGSIPNEIGKLKRLDTLILGHNRLSGTIPQSLFNLSFLTTLSFDSSGIHGNLPQDLGLLLPNLQILNLYSNYLSGHVPKSLSNLSKLVDFDISENYFTGKFLFSGKNMPNLLWLDLALAFRMGDEVDADANANDVSFIETLINCSSLTDLQIGMSNFRGILPNAIVNLSTDLEIIQLQLNQISGSLPLGMSKFVNLVALILSDNQLTGPIPDDIGEMQNLEDVFISNNNITGSIPPSFGNLSRLSNLRLHDNHIVGQIPPTLGNNKYLLKLYLSGNKLSGVIPPDLFYASQLIELVINKNNIEGQLPVEISNLKNLVILDVSENKFSGQIPSTLGSCIDLLELHMGGNSFSGPLPQSLSSLKDLRLLNLSHNNISGQIPTYFSDMPFVTLDLSFNSFEGEVPVKGVFSNATVLSLIGNKKLCGGVSELHLPRCPSQRKSERRKVSLKMLKIIISIVAAIVVIVALVLALLFYFLNYRRKKEFASSGSSDIRGFLEVSYRMLWEGTQGFSPSNLIGVGGFGSVFKGIIRQGEEELQVAVKVMNLRNERANKSLIAECKALRNIRHRNLVKIITACSSIDYKGNDFKALVYELMPKGNLESWLHSVGFDQPHCLSLLQRLSIVIDVACAIDYLHNECPTPIIHCDLKPSNILLDDEMTAHVSDFGLAKFLLEASGTGDQTNSSQVRGTVGYTAPEYGIGSKISTEGDVYSFGIIVLEIITSKKPTDPTFSEDINLHDFAKSAMPDQVMEIVDPKLIDDNNMWLSRNNADIRKIECVKLLINIGIQCSEELPQERMSIKDVVNQLKSAKQNLLGRII